MASRRRSKSQLKRWLSPARAASPILAIVVTLAAIVSTQQGWITIQPPGGSKQMAVVQTDVLNIRAAPTTTAQVVGTGVEGEEVEVIGGAENGFYPVRASGVQGWMSASYLLVNGERSKDSVPAQTEAGVALAAEVPSRQPEEPAPPEPEETETAVPQHEPRTQPSDEVAAEPVVPTGERWIEIDRSSATVTLHHGETIVGVFSGRIGRDPSPDGYYSTAVGTYYVYSMNKGLAPTPFAEDTYLTDWVGFDPQRSNGIHSPVRDANGVEKEWQNQTTLGCVRLSAADAVTVFEFAEIGMRVVVHE